MAQLEQGIWNTDFTNFKCFKEFAIYDLDCCI